ncbi:integrase catalytic domain-containing protein [Trichonephila clavipes]|nr:integrase catalytic domain-containing protein [Trichonephila clavipes]
MEDGVARASRRLDFYLLVRGRFVISKSTVAPIKKITLPRLELMGAVIAARLVKDLKRIFKDIKRIVKWKQVREKYWILKALQTMKSHLKKCITCRRFNFNQESQVITPLPDVCETGSPFAVARIDFAGPLFVKDSDAKQNILIITYAVTRSVNLELVDSMTTDTHTFLPFRHFIAQRSLCYMRMSDNARMFKHAELKLSKRGKC